jgi:TonB family protein
MSTPRVLLAAAAALLMFVAGASAQAPAPAPAAPNSLAAARILYASAEYGGALDMLNGLRSENPTQQERQSIDLYRALCLVAVGDMAEAHRIIDGMISEDPLYRPPTDDVPPRLRAAFGDARRRLLPGIVQQGYIAAKAAFDKKEYPEAARGFTQVLAALSDPDIESVSAQPPLADLKVLATGFHDLAVKAATPPPPPPAPEPPPAPVAPAPEPVADPTPRVYSPADPNVVPPTTVRQTLPPYPGRVMPGAMVIEVTIDETGAVQAATMEGEPNPAYDRAVLTAAKSWEYRPATLNGTPVKYRKRIQITLAPPSK